MSNVKKDLIKEVLSIVSDTKKGLFGAVDKLKEQSPLLFKEIIRGELAGGMLSVFLSSIVLFVSIFLTIFFYGKVIDDMLHDSGGHWFGVVVSGLMCVGAFVWFACGIESMLQAIIAPRIVILNYITNLFKKD